MRLKLVFIAMVFLSTISATHANQAQLFESGIKAFEAKKYKQAIRYFNQAKQQGYNQLVIEYNLGVSHYKLGQYQQAEQAFRKTLSSPKLKQIGQYNLGLIRLKQKQKREAIEWFKKAAADQTNPKIAALAERMLGKYQTRKKRKNFLDGGVTVAYGHDSNVAQAATGTPSERSDNIFETYAYLNVLFDRVDLGINYYLQDFSSINDNDFSQLGVNIKFPFKHNKWRITPSLHYAESELNNRDYQDVGDLRLEAKRYVGKGDYVRFRYRYSDINSKEPYDYLDGLRHQLRAEHYTVTRYGRFRFRYEYEYNSRQNSDENNYSPTRNTLRVQLKNSLPGKFRMKNEVLVRDSHYDENTNGFVRKDYRYQYRLHLYTIPFKDFETGVRFTYTDNNSNLPRESFIRRVTQAYLNYYF